MNVSFSDLQSDFSLESLNLHMTHRFSTATSIGFGVGSMPTDMREIRTFGWLEVHYPCVDADIEAYVTVLMPDEYVNRAILTQIVKGTFEALGIPQNTGFWAKCSSSRGVVNLIDADLIE